MKIRTLIPALILTLTSCGGGGGGGGSSLAGTWNLTLVQYQDDCNLNDSSIITPTYLVNQDGTNVAAENLATGFTFTGGTVEGGSGFVATRTGDVIPCPTGQNAAIEQTMIFQDVRGDTAPEVDIVVSFTCPFIGECTVAWTGSGERE